MSVSSEVQRTLVKSPPELWAELSDPTSLARHLGELGEIRIVRTEPERAVDWEAAAADGAQASGRVEIAPSGWGTRVTLSASRIVTPKRSEPEPEPEATEIIPEPEAESIAIPEPALETTEPEPEALELESSAKPSEPAQEPEIAERESRRGLFARLFRRSRTSRAPVELQVEPESAAEMESKLTVEPQSPEPIELEKLSEEVVLEEAAPEADIAAELAELEEQTTAMLTGVLDRLGAAHHRPFSRA